MPIDWDLIANDAEHTPSALLLEFLADLEGVDTCVVIVNKLDDEGNDSWRYESSGSALKVEAIVGAALRDLKRRISAGSD